MPFSADEAFHLLRESHARGRFAQAYLITGAPGAGKRRLLGQIAALLLPTAEDPLRHPDVHAIEPQMKSRVIGAEPMQSLLGSLHMRSLMGGPKLAIIHDADRMNASAANALLRTLEEPPGASYFFLLSTQPEQLLETILSRCIEVPLRTEAKPALTPAQQTLLNTLRAMPVQGDLPGAFSITRRFTELLSELKAAIEEETDAAFSKEEAVFKQVGTRKDVIDEREDFFKAMTESRYRAEREKLLTVVEEWFADALRHQHGGTGLDHPEAAEETARFARELSTPELLRRSAALGELRDQFNRSIQEQLAIECAFLAAFSPS